MKMGMPVVMFMPMIVAMRPIVFMGMGMHVLVLMAVYVRMRMSVGMGVPMGMQLVVGMVMIVGMTAGMAFVMAHGDSPSFHGLCGSGGCIRWMAFKTGLASCLNENLDERRFVVFGQAHALRKIFFVYNRMHAPSFRQEPQMHQMHDP